MEVGDIKVASLLPPSVSRKPSYALADPACPAHRGLAIPASTAEAEACSKVEPVQLKRRRGAKVRRRSCAMLL